MRRRVHFDQVPNETQYETENERLMLKMTGPGVEELARVLEHRRVVRRAIVRLRIQSLPRSAPTSVSNKQNESERQDARSATPHGLEEIRKRYPASSRLRRRRSVQRRQSRIDRHVARRSGQGRRKLQIERRHVVHARQRIEAGPIESGGKVEIEEAAEGERVVGGRSVRLEKGEIGRRRRDGLTVRMSRDRAILRCRRCSRRRRVRLAERPTHGPLRQRPLNEVQPLRDRRTMRRHLLKQRQDLIQALNCRRRDGRALCPCPELNRRRGEEVVRGEGRRLGGTKCKVKVRGDVGQRVRSLNAFGDRRLVQTVIRRSIEAA